jgi:hypothetical protein
LLVLKPNSRSNPVAKVINSEYKKIRQSSP